MSDRTKGLLATVISAAYFGFIPLFVKTICAGGGNSITASLLRFSIAVPIMFVFLKMRGVSLKITASELANTVLITVFGYGGTAVLLFSSYNYIPSGMSTTLHFMYPVFTILGCVIFLREKVSPVKILCVILCFAGILFFYNNGGDGSSNIMGMGLALLSGMTYAFYTIYLDKSGLQEMGSLKLIFYMNIVAAVMIFITASAAGELSLELTPLACGTAIFFAAATSFIGALGYQIGVRYIGPQNAAILSTFEPITSLIVGVAVYNEGFGLRTLLGCVCILSSVVIVAKMED